MPSRVPILIWLIDYNMVLLTRGDLPNVKSSQAESKSSGQITFLWTDNSGSGMAGLNDKAFVAVYCQELNDWIYSLDLAERSAGSYVFNVAKFSGRTVQAYIGFLSFNGKDVSDSLYVGAVPVD